MKIWLVLLIMFSAQIMAQISVRVDPMNPVAGESFYVAIKVKTEKSVDPFVSFDPSGVEVIGRSQSSSMNSIFSNGRLKTSREYTYTYELVAQKPRTVYLKNISVDIGDKQLNHKDVSIRVSREKKVSNKETYVAAEVSNLSPYVGEGVDVRYYLYTRSDRVKSADIKQFPKLNGFIKRFHDIRDGVERVNVNNN